MGYDLRRRCFMHGILRTCLPSSIISHCYFSFSFYFSFLFFSFCFLVVLFGPESEVVQSCGIVVYYYCYFLPNNTGWLAIVHTFYHCPVYFLGSSFEFGFFFFLFSIARSQGIFRVLFTICISILRPITRRHDTISPFQDTAQDNVSIHLPQ